MENRFNFYDFLAHFIPGFLGISALILLLFSPHEVGQFFGRTESYKYVISLVLVFVSYALGHIISQLASLFLERVLVRRWVKYPSENFFTESEKKPLVFRDYRRPYSRNFAKRFKEVYEAKFSTDFQHYDAFMTCFHFVKDRSAPTLIRLNTFLAVYDFCRNTSMGFLLLALGFLARGFATGTYDLLLFGAISLLFATFFFYRYLKFYRQYGDEVFRSFYILSKP